MIESIWSLLKENSFIGALASGILLILIGWVISVVRKKIRANNLYRHFENQLLERDKKYLSTHLLSSVTGYTENEVEILCSSHKKITRNEREKQSWRISSN